MLLSRVSAVPATLPLRISAPRRIVVVRVTVLLALALFFGAVAAVVLTGPVHQPLAPADARFIHARLLDSDQGVRAQLVRVRPGGGLARAQRRTRNAVAATTSLGLALRRADGPAAVSLRIAVASEQRFLDAVGSVLSNPRSPRLAELPALDLAARRSIAAVDGPRARRTSGVAALQRLRGSDGRKPVQAAA
jgi:hypothetical protein